MRLERRARFTHSRGPPRCPESCRIGSSGVGRRASPKRGNAESLAARADAPAVVMVARLLAHVAARMQARRYAAAKTAFLTAWGSAIGRNNAFG